MKISIHQPNFFPWLGYFKKLNYSDIFLFLDDSFVHKKNLDYLNRSSFIFNHKKKFFSVPIKRNFLTKKISEVEIEHSISWKSKFLNSINENYKKKKFFDEGIYIINEILSYDTKFITEFNINAIKKLIKILDLKTKINYSSNFNLDTNSSQKILDLVKLNNCKKYISGVGGKNYLNQKEFSKEKIEIIFLKSEVINYNQGNINFIPGLSILDLLFNCGIKYSSKLVKEK